MWQHLRPVALLAGALAGAVIFFLYKAEPVPSYQYPHPQNVDTRVYRDRNGICYKYKANEVDCDANEGTLKTYPLQV